MNELWRSASTCVFELLLDVGFLVSEACPNQLEIVVLDDEPARLAKSVLGGRIDASEPRDIEHKYAEPLSARLVLVVRNDTLQFLVEDRGRPEKDKPWIMAD